jgi:hypothetical protein
MAVDEPMSNGHLNEEHVLALAAFRGDVGGDG